LLYSTYFGGSGDDIAYGIAADGTSAYITGSTTSSTDFPAAGTGVYQSANGGGTDAFLAKITNPVVSGGTTTSATLAYSTFIGGTGTDTGLGITVDKNQGARITGWTNSTNIVSLNSSIQLASGGGYDAFAARIDTTATTATAPGHYFTYLGGAADDFGTSIAVDPQLASYVVGETKSSTFPIAPSALQVNLSGTSDAFISKLGPVLSLILNGAATPSIVGVGNQVSFTYTITNAGDAANEISFTDTLPVSGASFSSPPTISGGSCGSASGGIVGCFLGTLNAGATSTATVFLTPTASTTPSTVPIQLGNSASVGVTGATIATAFTTVTVNDFNISVAPSTRTVPAGVPASYTLTVTPTGPIPDSVSVACTSGLPTGATCTQTTNPFPDLNNGAVSTELVINSQARVSTTTELHRSGPLFYGITLPFAGLVLFGVRGSVSRRKRVLSVLLFGAFFCLVVLQPACSSNKTTTTTSGTPAGTYVITVAATSGSATRNATVTLVVQ